jgi:hypothetical protein
MTAMFLLAEVMAPYIHKFYMGNLRILPRVRLSQVDGLRDLL